MTHLLSKPGRRTAAIAMQATLALFFLGCQRTGETQPLPPVSSPPFDGRPGPEATAAPAEVAKPAPVRATAKPLRVAVPGKSTALWLGLQESPEGPAVWIALGGGSTPPASNARTLIGTGRHVVPWCLLSLGGSARAISLATPCLDATAESSPGTQDGQHRADAPPVAAKNAGAGQPPALLALLAMIDRGTGQSAQREAVLVDSSSLEVLWRQTINQQGGPSAPFETVEMRLEKGGGSQLDIVLVQHALPRAGEEPFIPGPPLTLRFAATNAGRYSQVE